MGLRLVGGGSRFGMFWSCGEGWVRWWVPGNRCRLDPNPAFFFWIGKGSWRANVILLQIETISPNFNRRIWVACRKDSIYMARVLRLLQPRFVLVRHQAHTGAEVGGVGTGKGAEGERRAGIRKKRERKTGQGTRRGWSRRRYPEEPEKRGRAEAGTRSYMEKEGEGRAVRQDKG